MPYDISKRTPVLTPHDRPLARSPLESVRYPIVLLEDGICNPLGGLMRLVGAGRAPNINNGRLNFGRRAVLSRSRYRHAIRCKDKTGVTCCAGKLGAIPSYSLHSVHVISF